MATGHWARFADGGQVVSGIPPDRVIGCVVYPAAELIAPGVVKHIEGDRFPDGRSSDRVNRISQCFVNAGFKAPVLDNIRSEIWLKLWGNLTFNPISSLTHSTLVDICQYAPSRTSWASSSVSRWKSATQFRTTVCRLFPSRRRRTR